MTAAIIMTNRSQAIRLPAEVRFSEEIKKRSARIVGNEGLILIRNNLREFEQVNALRTEN
ncbi:hypothetical protein BKK49_10255 [Rodentibacter rarus]|uniref:SpoVT-AbrB domain-containing protein n=1 Tax=Rodentibacter rarus TaxID=1908260 RepID=A0A1V3IQJ6_9PAST|nr:AbrB/MazE/SpoVT family DNA-binding domain-containing protein [Rodentibacter rarus]OOF38159.1 hypothetical protein BKK49_10255 [Rodentibacter rarus]OOF44507.1 hypothetical protein BKK50_02390 [Rodentibacter rarus]